MKAETRLRFARVVWGFVPHPGQRPFLLCTAKTRVASCGRRWGKTRAVAVDAASYAVTEQGSVQMIVSPTYDQSRLAFDEIVRLVESVSWLSRISHVVRTPYPRIRIGRSLVMARTCDDGGRNLRGHYADRVFVDEAAFVAGQTIDEVLRPMLADRDGSLTLISTPSGHGVFGDLFERGMALEPNIRSFSGHSADNPHVSARYIEGQRALLPDRVFRQEYLGELVSPSDAFLSYDDLAFAGSRTLVPLPCRCVAGVDWGRWQDETAVVVLRPCVEGFAVEEAHTVSGDSWDEIVEGVVAILRSWRVGNVACDQTGLGDPLLELLTERWPGAAYGVVFTHPRKRQLMHNMALALERRLLAWRDEARQLARQLAALRVVSLPSGLTTVEGVGEHDDLPVALALALDAACDGASVLAAASEPDLLRSEWVDLPMPRRYRA